MVAQMPDIVVTDKKRWPVMSVEVQNHISFNRDYAIHYRKDFVPDMAIAGKTKYLMLTSEEKAYVWSNNDQAPADAPPSFELDMRPVVKHFREKFGKEVNGERIRSGALRLYLRFWIEEGISPISEVAGSVPVPQEFAPIFDEWRGGFVEEEADEW